MKNLFHNNCFCFAFIGILLLAIIYKFVTDNTIIENMPSRLNSPGMITGTQLDTDDTWVNIPNNKLKMLKKLNNDPNQYKFRTRKEFFDGQLNYEEEEEEKEEEDGEEEDGEEEDGEEEDGEEEDGEEEEDEEDEEDIDNPNKHCDTYYDPNFYSDDEYNKRLQCRKNKYNTGVYPQPINDRPDLSQCQPCPPCTNKKTVVIHKLCPKLLRKIKRKLRN